ncbi:MAG: signal peptidase I [Candidatus Nealsonbacteria bacterium]|nr:signal peptidase I [Candidatus Nealsonbacteria bacterium]
MKNFLIFIWEVSKIVVVALLIVVPIRYFIFQPFFVRGQSMEPSFFTGDYLIIDELSYHLRSPERGETIVFKYPNNPSQKYIKRIIGLPGETIQIEGGQIIIYKDGIAETLNESSYLADFIETAGAVRVSLSQDEYFVLGDNRAVSSDSRRWGAVPEDNIIGRVFLRAWPFTALAKI